MESGDFVHSLTVVRANLYVSIACLGTGRLDAQTDEAASLSCSAGRSVDRRLKLVKWLDYVVGVERYHDRAGIRAFDLVRGPYKCGSGASRNRLDQERVHVQAGNDSPEWLDEAGSREDPYVIIADEATSALECIPDQRSFTSQGQELFWSLGCRSRPEPGSDATGEHHGISIRKRRV